VEIPAIGTKSERLTAELAKQEQVMAHAAHSPLTLSVAKLSSCVAASMQFVLTSPSLSVFTASNFKPLSLMLIRCWKACETASRARWRRSRGSCRRAPGRILRFCPETVGLLTEHWDAVHGFAAAAV